MSGFRYRIVLWHGFAWLLFFSFIITFIITSRVFADVWDLILSQGFLVFSGIYVSLYYLNARFLFPRLYLRKKLLLYFAAILVLFVAVYFLRPFDKLMHSGSSPISLVSPNSFGTPHAISAPGGPPRSSERDEPALDIMSLVIFLMIWSLSTASQLIRQWKSEREKAAIAEAEKAHAELAFLKAQINPHFLFNTLNNIYSLAVSNSEHTAPSIMKLSKIMRYVTDEVTNNFVPLESEVQCITDYIELQKLKLNKKTTVDFQVKGRLQDRQIGPLVLVPFVENLFKYGVSSHEASTVTIHVCANEKEVTLLCRNTIYNGHVRTERTGIGIANTAKRLSFLYPDRHTLNIKQENNEFTVQLSLLV